MFQGHREPPASEQEVWGDQTSVFFTEALFAKLP